MNKHIHLLASAMLILSGSVTARAQTGVEGLLLSAPPAQNQATPAQPQPIAGGPVYPAQPQPVTPGVQAVPVPAEAPGGLSKNPRDEAFERALIETIPMTPGQIGTIREKADRNLRATVSPLNPGRPVSRSLRLTLRPGEETPVIRVQPGVVSTLTFSDVTGAPWPVLSVVTGNPQAYVAQSAGQEGKTNIIVVSAVQPHVPSNLVVTLVNHPVPVTFSLQHGAPETDYRVDARIEARGPNAAMDIVGVSTLAPTNDSTMMQFLDGVAPNGARRMRTTSSDVEAWRFEDMLYVRTRGDLLSPAYVSRSSNVSGLNVFVLNDSPVLLVSRDGRTAQVRILR